MLIKNAEALELLARVDTLVVDKTGTLTEGRPRVTAVDDRRRMRREDEVLPAGGGASSGAASIRWPRAIVRGGRGPAAWRRRRSSRFQVDDRSGVSGRVDGPTVVLGSAELMRARGIDPAALIERADAHRRDGQTVLFVAVDGALAGLIAVADPIRASARRRDSRAARPTGSAVVMLTGDNRATADGDRARSSASTMCAPRCCPATSASVVAELQRERTARGDGRRRHQRRAGAGAGRPSASRWAPAPTSRWRAPASRSSTATCAASSAPGGCRARRVRNIRQNLFLAFVYNALGVPVAAGVLYPFAGLLISPIWASAAMTLSSLSVIGNALRLRRG